LKFSEEDFLKELRKKVAQETVNESGFSPFEQLLSSTTKANAIP